MARVALLRDATTAIDLARRSFAWDRISRGDVELTVAVPTDEAIVLGAFQRGSEVDALPALPRLRRGSGGGAAHVGPGTVWIQLALRRPDALVPCTPDKLLSRYVRPLLGALTRVTRTPAHYFGRDWVSASHRPIALVSFAHEASSNTCMFEAIVGVNAVVALGDRASFRGRSPVTCNQICGRTIDPSSVLESIVVAYGVDSEIVDVGHADVAFAERSEVVVGAAPSWTVIREEAIGTLAAGRDASGRLEVGGELMASRDAMERLRDEIAKLSPTATPDEIGSVVDDALTGHGAITFGVRSLASIRDALLDTRRAFRA